MEAAQARAEDDQRSAQDRFRRWAAKRVPDAEQMNIGSGPQIRQLLFAGLPNAKNDQSEKLELERVFKVRTQEPWPFY